MSLPTLVLGVAGVAAGIFFFRLLYEKADKFGPHRDCTDIVLNESPVTQKRTPEKSSIRRRKVRAAAAVYWQLECICWYTGVVLVLRAGIVAIETYP
jgi:hypothetical protein